MFVGQEKFKTTEKLIGIEVLELPYFLTHLVRLPSYNLHISEMGFVNIIQYI